MSRRILGLEIREESIAAVLLDSGFKGSVLEGKHLPHPQFYHPDQSKRDLHRNVALSPMD